VIVAAILILTIIGTFAWALWGLVLALGLARYAAQILRRSPRCLERLHLTYSFGGAASSSALIFGTTSRPSGRAIRKNSEMVEQKFGAQRVAQIPRGLQQTVADLAR
jgi:hypothetical protein